MPSYKFYQDGKENKFEENIKGVAPEFRVLHLYNIILSPIDQFNNLKLEISIDESSPSYSVLLSNLFRVPSNESMLFFDVRNKYKTIILPAGFKNVTFKVIALPEAKDFELSLSCDYNISVSKI